MMSLLMKGDVSIDAPLKKCAWFSISLLVLLLDQSTKIWASSTLVYAQAQSFLPYFNFTLLHNYGAAFSFLADAGGWQRILFGVIALCVSVFLIFWILCIKANKKVELAGLCFVLGGALGNLWDRVILGYVVDFVDWFYVSDAGDCLPFFYSIFSTNSCHWPAFNIADASILLGVGFLLVDMFFFDKEEASS